MRLLQQNIFKINKKTASNNKFRTEPNVYILKKYLSILNDNNVMLNKITATGNTTIKGDNILKIIIELLTLFSKTKLNNGSDTHTETIQIHIKIISVYFYNFS